MALWRDAYGQVDIDEERRVVVLVRTAVDFPSVEALQQSLSGIVAQLAALRRSDYAMLHDLRAARGRNDPAFEAAMEIYRPRLSQGFRRVAALASSHVGRLHIQRHFDKDGGGARVFLDEDEALRWLQES